MYFSLLTHRTRIKHQQLYLYIVHINSDEITSTESFKFDDVRKQTITKTRIYKVFFFKMIYHKIVYNDLSEFSFIIVSQK